MILQKGGHVIDIGYAQLPREEHTNLVQATTTTASGVKHTEHYNVVLSTETYRIELASEDIFLLFKQFFVDYAMGQANSFVLTDDLGTQKTVTFTSSSFPRTLVATGADNKQLYSWSFQVEEVVF